MLSLIDLDTLLQMYAPNEYYKPYNPSQHRSRDRYRERQRVPPQ